MGGTATASVTRAVKRGMVRIVGDPTPLGSPPPRRVVKHGQNGYRSGGDAGNMKLVRLDFTVRLVKVTKLLTLQLADISTYGWKIHC